MPNPQGHPSDAKLVADMDQLDKLAHQMDALFCIPGTEIRVGADSLLGLIPAVGDAVALAPSGYIMLRSRQLGASWPLLTRMGVNVTIDTLIGAIPLVGDLFDIGWKGNLRNVALLRRHLERKGAIPKDSPKLQTTKAA